MRHRERTAIEPDMLDSLPGSIAEVKGDEHAGDIEPEEGKDGPPPGKREAHGEKEVQRHQSGEEDDEAPPVERTAGRQNRIEIERRCGHAVARGNPVKTSRRGAWPRPRRA